MLTTKQLNTKIAGVRKSTASLRQNIHEILCNAAAHAYVHGDVTAFTRLFDAASGMNRKRIAAWVRDYGFAALQKDGTFKLNKSARKKADFPDGEALVTYLMDEVRPWYADEESAAQITKELDVAKRLTSLTSQIKHASEKNTVVKVDFQAVRKAMAELDDAMRAADGGEELQVSF
jgi:hypothetical protein